MSEIEKAKFKLAILRHALNCENFTEYKMLFDDKEISSSLDKAIQALQEKAEREKQPNGWILVAERLPESEEEVLILTEKNTITTAMYEDGKTPADESDWNWYEVEFEYDEESGIYYVPEGWWEYKHFNPDEVHNYVVDEKVIAWQPLPEQYKAVEG